jgi:hypothetical protein
VKNRLLGESRLFTAVTALEDFDVASPVTTMPVVSTSRALEASRPAGRLHRSLTLLLFAVRGEKLVQAHTRLELKAIHFHGNPSAESVPRYVGILRGTCDRSCHSNRPAEDWR